MAKRTVFRRFLEIVLDRQSALKTERDTQEALRRGTDSKQPVKNLSAIEKGVQGVRKVALQAAAAFAAWFAASRLARMAKDAVLLAARYETLGVVVRRVGANAGYTAVQVDAAEKALRKSGIAAVEARGTLTRLIQANVDLAHATDLARVAQNAAVIAGTNSSEAFEQLVYGIQSANVRVLRTIGLNVSFERSYQKLAAQLGKTTAQLTENEKVQARVNAVTEAGEGIMGAYEDSMGTAGKAAGSMTRLVDDLKVKVGQLGLAIFRDLVFETSDELIRAEEALDNFGDQNLQEWGEIASKSILLVLELLRFLTRALWNTAQNMWHVERATHALFRLDLQGFKDRLGMIRGELDDTADAYDHLAQRIADLWVTITVGPLNPRVSGGPTPRRAMEELREEVALTAREIQNLEDARLQLLTTALDLGSQERSIRLELLDIYHQSASAIRSGTLSLEDWVRATDRARKASDALGGLIPGTPDRSGRHRTPTARQATVVETQAERQSRLVDAMADEWMEHNEMLVDAAQAAAMGFSSAWEDAFLAMRAEGNAIANFMEGLFRGLAASGLGALAQYASQKVAMNVAEAIEQFARALGWSFLNPAQAAASTASAKQHLAAAAAWGVLGGAAGAAQRAVGGGGSASMSGGLPRGATDPTGRMVDQFGRMGPEITIYVDGVDPSNPRHQAAVGNASREYTERYGGRITVKSGSPA